MKFKNKLYVIVAASAGITAALLAAQVGAEGNSHKNLQEIAQHVSGVDDAITASGAQQLPAAPAIAASPRRSNSPAMAPRSFFPIDIRETDSSKLWPLNDSVNRDIMDKMVLRFKNHFSDVEFEVDWEDDTVNAQAWVDENGQRHIKMFGGLIRHKSLGSGAVSLVAAHEVGHHFAGEPTYPQGLSCEGQADYWGAKDAMRTLYDKEYRKQMVAAIAEISNFFSADRRFETMRGPDTLRGCGHPPGACRIRTYQAGLDQRAKPECANFIPASAI